MDEHRKHNVCNFGNQGSRSLKVNDRQRHGARHMVMMTRRRGVMAMDRQIDGEIEKYRGGPGK